MSRRISSEREPVPEAPAAQSAPVPVAAPAPAAKRPGRRTLRPEFFVSCAKDQSIAPEPPKCIVCAKDMSHTISTVTQKTSHLNCVYFYSAHKACWEAISEAERRLYTRNLERLLEEGAT